MTQAEFFTAPVMSVTCPEGYKTQPGFISVAQYPRGFEAEDEEVGMIVHDEVIETRIFNISKSWPW